MQIKKLIRMGNSLAVVLPSNIIRALNLSPGEYVTLRTDLSGRVVIGRLEDYLLAIQHARDDRPRPDQRAPAPAARDD